MVGFIAGLIIIALIILVLYFLIESIAFLFKIALILVVLYLLFHFCSILLGYNFSSLVVVGLSSLI
ncbi:hypothetical protein [Methanobrevibacter sp. 87.7]|uniref:hypothetical protein n=1 Tax=Methanobrevibacter sp. 87.7 TaxID=387957 RepID=UPI00118029D5|nr:hypothetical protein [Methanobrevibacter sp. 87.7]